MYGTAGRTITVETTTTAAAREKQINTGGKTVRDSQAKGGHHWPHHERCTVQVITGAQVMSAI